MNPLPSVTYTCSRIIESFRKLFLRGKVRHGIQDDPAQDFSALNRQMLEVKKELELVFDTIPEEICIIDRNYTILRANRSLAESSGKCVSDLIGKPCYQIFWGRESSCPDCPSKLAFELKEPIIKRSFTLASGDKKNHYEVSSYPVFNESGNVDHVIEIRKSITDEKNMFEYLLRSEKLISIGNMTSGIAHEMNNPLSGISGNASNLLHMPEKYGLNEKGISRVTAILNLATRATAIMNDLLHFSQRPEQLFIFTNINDLIVKTINSMHMTGAQEIEQTFTLDATIPKIYCDPSKMQQVIINLSTNALQAIIDKKKKHPDPAAFRGRLSLVTRQADDQMVITITDNGIGIPEDLRNRIFDPFFSTRPPGQGTGLGLSVSNKIIEEHGGKIFFECVNGFTIFSVFLPLRRQEPDNHKPVSVQ